MAMTPEEMGQEIEVLKRQVKALRVRSKETWELLDVLATPPWRRIWFTLCGWHPWKVGRWYGKE